MPLNPWYRVVTLRKEVREGRSFSPDEFAIALEQVVAGTAPPDYSGPAQFFAFVRHPTKENGIEFHPESDEEKDEQIRTLRADVQDTMQAIGSRNLASISLERREDFKLYLRGAYMSYLKVRAARMSGAYLSKANLSGAVLPYAGLFQRQTAAGRPIWSAVPPRRSVRRHVLWGAYLSKAMLYDANLSGADLCGVDAHSRVYKEPVHGLTQVQLDEARAYRNNPPQLAGVLDAETGKPLIWRGRTR